MQAPWARPAVPAPLSVAWATAGHRLALELRLVPAPGDTVVDLLVRDPDLASVPLAITLGLDGGDTPWGEFAPGTTAVSRDLVESAPGEWRPATPIRWLPAGDPPGVMRVDHNWKDTWALRLGGDVNLLDGALSLRWGLSYESSSVPEEWTRVDYAQWETFGVSGGVTVRLPWYGVELTAGYLHLFMPDRTVTNGQARKLSAFPTDPADPEMIINNGSYRTSMDIFSVGVQATF